MAASANADAPGDETTDQSSVLAKSVTGSVGSSGMFSIVAHS
jgi:hypothetical protein